MCVNIYSSLDEADARIGNKKYILQVSFLLRFIFLFAFNRRCLSQIALKMSDLNGI